MEAITIKIEKTLELTNENINDLLVTAFEGGINYWCGKVKIKSIPDGADVQYASDVISIGGTLELQDIESPDKWDLTLEKMLKGIKWYCEQNGYTNADDLMDNHDADTADAIVQYALFDEVVFG
jgi:hypothetical protein